MAYNSHDPKLTEQQEYALRALLRGPRTSYQVAVLIERNSLGAFSPTTGATHHVLRRLEDRGFVRRVDTEPRNVWELTAKGRRSAEELAT